MEGKGAVVFLPREDGRFNWMLEELMFAPPAVWMAEALRAENASLRAENDKLRPMAEQYSTIKEHLAGIELDAHQRAEEYERGVHERLAAMIGDCRAHCDSVLSTLGNTCINVTGELRRAENSISSLPAAFNALRAGLEKLEEDK